MGVYPARSVERAMKFQEVILKAMSKQITWMQAAEILGMSDRILVLHAGRIAGEFTAADATQERILAAALGNN